MILPDSGERRQFPTGAVRDIAQGKGRCDLLPLDVLASWTGDEILASIHLYLCTGDTGHLEDAMELFIDSEYKENLHDAMLDVAKQFEDGAIKYGENNWRKGIYLHCYIDSAVRHYLKYRRGDEDEPHHRAFLWNLTCAIWTHKNKPEMIDIPTIDVNGVDAYVMAQYIHRFCRDRSCSSCPLNSNTVPCSPRNDINTLTNNYNIVKEYIANESNTCTSDS